MTQTIIKEEYFGQMKTGTEGGIGMREVHLFQHAESRLYGARFL